MSYSNILNDKSELRNLRVYPKNPQKYSCFEHGSGSSKSYDCTYNDFKNVYFSHRFSRDVSIRQKEFIITVPFYIPEYFISSYIALYLTGNILTPVHIRKKNPFYSEEWGSVINEGKCYVK